MFNYSTFLLCYIFLIILELVFAILYFLVFSSTINQYFSFYICNTKIKPNIFTIVNQYILPKLFFFKLIPSILIKTVPSNTPKCGLRWGRFEFLHTINNKVSVVKINPLVGLHLGQPYFLETEGLV